MNAVQGPSHPQIASCIPKSLSCIPNHRVIRRNASRAEVGTSKQQQLQRQQPPQGQGQRLRHQTHQLPAASLFGPALPLVQGLKAVPGGVNGLVGWQVVAHSKQRQYTTVGTVQQVHTIQPPGVGGPSYQLLHVLQDTVLQPYGFRGREEHNVPVVPDIIAALHLQQQLVVITPPEGLLDLGCRELLLAFLSRELQQYAKVQPALTSAAGAGRGDSGLSPQELTGARPLTCISMMPTQADLLAAGRSDLVSLIKRVGGFTEAALMLGMRCSRRPAGYWDSLEMLDMELDTFIAGCWVALPCPDAEDNQVELEMYFYNMATKFIRWTLPDAALQAAADAAAVTGAGTSAPVPTANVGEDPVGGVVQQHAGGSADGGTLGGDLQARGPAVMDRTLQQALLELQDERVMPTRTSIQAAGRWDLHHAVTRQGGYTAVAAALGRRQCRALPDKLLEPQGLKAALQDLALEESWDPELLPTFKQLQQVERKDLIRAIKYLGGWHKAAEVLQLQSARHLKNAWRGWSLSDLVQELELFMQQHPPAATPSTADTAKALNSSTALSQSSTTGNSNGSSADRSHSTASSRVVKARLAKLRQNAREAATQQQQQQQQQAHINVRTWMHLPTHAELLAAGRSDVVYSLHTHGYDAVRQHMGLLPRYNKPRIKGALQWQDVEAAVAAGCQTCKDILKFITQSGQQHFRNSPKQQQPSAQHWQQQPSAQQQQQQQRRPPAEPATPLVSREHLQRQLKVWCEDGRLVKVRHNCFRLPSQVEVV